MNQLPYTVKRAGFVTRRANLKANGFETSTVYATSFQFCNQSKLHSFVNPLRATQLAIVLAAGKAMQPVDGYVASMFHLRSITMISYSFYLIIYTLV